MTPTIVGPRQIASEQLHASKYRLPGESFRDAMSRVAGALQDNKEHYKISREILIDMRFLPAGRVQSAMGAPKSVTAYNCFVSGKIPDSFVDRDNAEQSSIMHRAEQAATTMRMGGGIGYDFSTLRPKGAKIRKIGSQSTGPLSFMEVYNAIGGATSSTGERRGAQMAVLRIDHPDIEQFINAKHDNVTLRRFNISVAVTDEFMNCLAAGKPFPLTFEGEVYKYVDPEELWEMLMRSTWEWAEPGVLFIDSINRLNNLKYCELISACNPCAEQVLPQFGACLLGSFNLVKYIRSNTDGSYYFDYDQFRVDIPPIVRMMDNVVDRAIYPLVEQSVEAKSKRRMGLGVTAMANALEAIGCPYGTKQFIEAEHKLLAFMTREIYLASVSLAEEKGAFPLFDADLYCDGEFIKTLDSDVQEKIRRSGLRNSHLISYAPTGTISMCADNVSSSIEPVYQWRTERPIEMPSGVVSVSNYDYGFQNFKVRGRRAANNEVSASEHVDVLVAAQSHCDSSVSKTVNCNGEMSWESFKNIYIDAYSRGAKGCTTYNRDGQRFGLFKQEIEPDDLPFPERGIGEIPHGNPDPESCSYDPATGRRTCE